MIHHERKCRSLDIVEATTPSRVRCFNSARTYSAVDDLTQIVADQIGYALTGRLERAG